AAAAIRRCARPLSASGPALCMGVQERGFRNEKSLRGDEDVLHRGHIGPDRLPALATVARGDQRAEGASARRRRHRGRSYQPSRYAVAISGITAQRPEHRAHFLGEPVARANATPRLTAVITPEQCRARAHLGVVPLFAPFDGWPEAR